MDSCYQLQINHDYIGVDLAGISGVGVSAGSIQTGIVLSCSTAEDGDVGAAIDQLLGNCPLWTHNPCA